MLRFGKDDVLMVTKINFPIGAPVQFLRDKHNPLTLAARPRFAALERHALFCLNWLMTKLSIAKLERHFCAATDILHSSKPANKGGCA